MKRPVGSIVVEVVAFLAMTAGLLALGMMASQFLSVAAGKVIP